MAALLNLDGRTDAASTLVRRAARLLMWGIVDAKREGKRAKFRIPPSLLRTLVPDA